MSLKINDNSISKIRFNNCNISQAKINGNVVFGESSNIKLSYYNGIFTVDSKKNGIYELYYAGPDGILEDYENIHTFNLSSNNQESYNYLNELNIAPPEATKIVLCDVQKNILIGLGIPDEMKLIQETKLYSAGLLSDIHIDGNGDGNNSDSGNSQSDFINALQYFNNQNVDFICIDGDITYYGYEADYEAYNSILNNYSNNIPIKAIRGNHECYVNGSNNYDYTNTKFQNNINNLYYEYTHLNDVYLFCGMYKENSITPFSDEELTWLASKLEEHKHKRVFLFVHYYYGETGNANHIVDIHSPISNQTFIDLITQYKNVIYFSGHTHLSFKCQKFGKYNNIKPISDVCSRVHIPSCSKPRISQDGLEGSVSVYAEGSEGYLMDVYTNYIILKGINFETNKFVPIAQYKLDT